MTKVKTFTSGYLDGLEKKINMFISNRNLEIINTSIATNTTSGISRNSSPSTYFVALVAYKEDKQ